MVRFFFATMTHPPKNNFIRDILLYTLFAISMAYLESAVVVYLRDIYYPSGFKFPLIPLSLRIYATEIGREAATILMLWAASGIRSKSRSEWFAIFMYNFAFWDIWYYIWLKVLVNWPVTLLDWDILFLIPLPWTGPVLAPVIISLMMIFAAIVILRIENSGTPFIFSTRDIVLGITAGTIIIGSFLWQTGNIVAGQVPDYFPWWIFASGAVLGLVVFLLRYRDISNMQKKPPETRITEEVSPAP